MVDFSRITVKIAAIYLALTRDAEQKRWTACTISFNLRLILSGLFLLSLSTPLAVGFLPPITCPAGAPIGSVDLRVQSPGKGDPLPLRTINRLEEGDTIRYAPLLRSNEKRKGDVSVVLVPSVHDPTKDYLVVLDPKSAEKPAEWKVPQKISVVAFVYGPDGLNRGRVKQFLSKDDELVSQLADYAEKTAQTEALIQALSSNGNTATVDAALQGFASQYGVGVKLDRTQPVDQQAMALFRTLNPAMATYDPLATQGSQRIGSTASLATSVAAIFFGSPVGLAAGGTAMLMELRSLAFPKSDFRSSFAEKLPSEGLALCGNRAAPAPHTKIAYLWASRVPNIGPPLIGMGQAASLPVAQKSPLPIEASDVDWKYVDRVRNWALSSAAGKPVPVGVQKLATGKALELDLTKANVAPGKYRLIGNWDWDPFTVSGDVTIHSLADFKTAKLDPDSQDRLIASKGKTPITIEGSDFEFVTKVEFEKEDDKFASPRAVPFVLPEGLRRGPQDRMDVQVDTNGLEPGRYRLLISQVDGKPQPVPVQVLPEPPKIENLPILVNRGAASHTFLLKGQHLDLIGKMETSEGTIELEPSGANLSERPVVVHMKQELQAGASFEIKEYVKDHSEPITLPDAIRIVGPRSKIVDSKISPPAGMEMSLHSGELPAGMFVSTMLQVENLESTSAVQLSCENQENAPMMVHIGDRSPNANLQQIGPDQLFLSFNTSGLPTGCVVRAVIDNGPDGASEPYRLGYIVRMPLIDSFKLTDESVGNGYYAGVLTGTDLETIEKTGWDAIHGNSVLGLPSPIPGEGQKQSLRIRMSWPSPAPHAPLYVWFRGEKAGRATPIHE